MNVKKLFNIEQLVLLNFDVMQVNRTVITALFIVTQTVLKRLDFVSSGLLMTIL